MIGNIWIFNHYAISPSVESHRHNLFAKHLSKDGYQVCLFFSSAIHNSNKNLINGKDKFAIEEIGKCKYIAIKTSNYQGNGKKRIVNILEYFFGLFNVTKKLKREFGKPDIIYASSVHPLTCVAGLLIAKRYNIKCIVEIRDLWPYTLIELGDIKNNSFISRFLYKLEYWIYKKADSIIFTMEGGRDYIIDKGWSDKINIDKVYYLNNGIDLQIYNEQKNNILDDNDLNNTELFKVIYIGSIRPANDIERIVKIAESLSKTTYSNKIVFLIYGDGTEKNKLENYCIENNIKNIIFKGMVDKLYIPYVLSNSDLLLLNYSINANKVLKYGGSHNKLFEYLAAGRPILSTVAEGYSIIEEYKCGIEIGDSNIKSIIDCILKFFNMPKEEYNQYCKNSLKASKEYDFKRLTNKLEQVINNTLNETHKELI